jgi:nucleotide-binding universal stress UspA family protein
MSCLPPPRPDVGMKAHPGPDARMARCGDRLLHDARVPGVEGLRVLAATRGSPSSLNACRIAAGFLSPEVDEVRLLTVLSHDLYPFSMRAGSPLSDTAERQRRVVASVNRALGGANEIFEQAGCRVSWQQRFGNPAEEILSEIRSYGPDFAVLGRWWPVPDRDPIRTGPVVRRVLHRARVPLLLVSPGAQPPSGPTDRTADRGDTPLARERHPKRILVLSDGSASALRASQVTARLLREVATVKLVAALPPRRHHARHSPAQVKRRAERAHQLLQDCMEVPSELFQAAGHHVLARRVDNHVLSAVLGEIAEWGPSLLVMGKRPSLGMVTRWEPASVTPWMLHRAGIPVLLGP